MHVEEDPGAVADEERGHDGHQQHAQVVVLHPAGAAPSLPVYRCTVFYAQNRLLPDHQPDLVIQERDGGEGDDAQHDKPGNHNELYFSILLKVVKNIDLF